MTIQDKSIWRNKKTDNIYTVVCSAKDANNNDYVIYQRRDKTPPTQSSFLVRHSESLLIGSCLLLPTANQRMKWFVEFQIHLDDMKLFDKELPWCRPSFLWGEKFVALDEE